MGNVTSGSGVKDKDVVVDDVQDGVCGPILLTGDGPHVAQHRHGALGRGAQRHEGGGHWDWGRCWLEDTALGPNVREEHVQNTALAAVSRKPPARCPGSCSPACCAAATFPAAPSPWWPWAPGQGGP